MIFSIFQVSRDRERWLTASVRYSTLCGVLIESSLSWNNESFTAAHVRDHSAAMVCFVQTGFAVTLFVTYLETGSVQLNDSSAYNVRKLHFQANLCEVFAENKKQHYCGDLVLGRPVTWGDKPLLKFPPWKNMLDIV